MKNKFKCRKTEFYGPCAKCIQLNGTCDYSGVMKHKDKSYFNLCPICLHKYIPKKYEECSYKKS